MLGCSVGFVRINGERINGLFHLLISGVYWCYNPLILTFDPNFQRDILVNHGKTTKSNSEFTPKNMMVKDKPFPFCCPVDFSGANCC